VHRALDGVGDDGEIGRGKGPGERADAPGEAERDEAARSSLTS
jgi:hypothetical protein